MSKIYSILYNYECTTSTSKLFALIKVSTVLLQLEFGQIRIYSNFLRNMVIESASLFEYFPYHAITFPTSSRKLVFEFIMFSIIDGNFIYLSLLYEPTKKVRRKTLSLPYLMHLVYYGIRRKLTLISYYVLQIRIQRVEKNPHCFPPAMTSSNED